MFCLLGNIVAVFSTKGKLIQTRVKKMKAKKNLMFDIEGEGTGLKTNNSLVSLLAHLTQNFRSN